MAGSGIPEAAELARGSEELPWWGEPGWLGLFKSCNLAVLGRYEEASAVLPLIKKASRLRRPPLLWDS